MKPYFQDDAVTIYHGDCREIVPTLGRFDLLLTDPPYGIGEAAGKNKSRSCIAVSKDYGNDIWDNKPVDLELLTSCISMAKYSIVFGGNYYVLPPTSCWLVGDKDNGNTDFADAEMAWTNLPMAVRLKKYKWQGMLQESGRKHETRLHPTMKPLEVMAWCISQADKKIGAQTILDPFAGSGTTGRAAKDMGRKAVLIEREERYCEIAAKRMAQGVLSLGMPEPKQESKQSQLELLEEE